MRRYIFGLIVLLAPLSAVADVLPSQPPPQPPAGPEVGVIRGVGVSRDYTYWRGRRWLTKIGSCDAKQAACKERQLPIGSSCFVSGIDGRAVAGGDIAALIESEKAAGSRPIKLQLENCGTLTEIELKP